jgi:hypothetical protein
VIDPLTAPQDQQGRNSSHCVTADPPPNGRDDQPF